MALQSNEAAKAALEAMMNVEQWRDKSSWYKEGIEQGIEQGIERGIEQGIERGIEQGLAEAREAVKDLCELLGVEVNAERGQALEQMDLAGLSALRKHVKQHRSWPGT
jgi:flagellar biosynthesis/type III secretory pathway protein FliH